MNLKNLNKLLIIRLSSLGDILLTTPLIRSIKKNNPKNWLELKKSISEAGCRRIRPLVMTTTTTVMALLPVMWATGQGSEVMKPMAIPTLGGMGIELISLFVVPVIFSYVYERKMNTKET